MIKKMYRNIARRATRLKRDWKKPILERRVNVAIVQPVILDVIAHDPEAFTQGLICQNGYLYESAGLYGHSSLRQMLPDGTIVRRIDLPGVFAEDLAISENELVLLTWRENIAIRYALPSLERLGFFCYRTEGWGLTHDGNVFFMSNGGGSLLMRDKHFKIIRKIPVKLDGRPVNGLNALEYVSGKIYANTWRSDFILEIDSHSGKVQKIADCSALVDIEKPRVPDDMLNGTAYCGDGDFFYLTGKRWKHIFRVKIS